MPNYQTGNINYTTTDPKKVAAQNRQLIGTQAGTLNQEALQQGDQAQAQSQQTQDYLGNVESPIAQGQGGYNASETSQIEMTPQQQQQMVTGAGISAGTGTAATVGAADRASAATGGNPLATTAYRARAAQQEGSQAGDAMTQARVAASNTEAARAENVGSTRLGQQDQALGYYGGLQAQQAGEAQSAYGRQQQTYGTEAGGLTSGANTAESASQNPSTFDKVMGGVSGALSFLDDGDIAVNSTPAVVGENGPEKVVDLSQGGSSVPSLAAAGGGNGGAGSTVGTTTVNPNGTLTYQAPNTPATSQQGVPWWKTAMQKMQSMRQPQSSQPSSSSPQSGASAPGRVQPAASSIGQIGGKVASLFLADGGVVTASPKMTGAPHMPIAPHVAPPSLPRTPAAPRVTAPPLPRTPTAPQAQQGAGGIFTQPTRVNLKPNEAVVPLSYRAGAKVRPSMAALPAARVRQPYPGARV